MTDIEEEVERKGQKFLNEEGREEGNGKRFCGLPDSNHNSSCATAPTKSLELIEFSAPARSRTPIN
jgi:hypothetical protein